MRTPDAPSASAISSARFVTLDSFVPRLSSSSYRVTDGPRVTLMMLASMLKLCSVSASRSAFCRISCVPSAAAPVERRSRSTGGYRYSGSAGAVWISAAICAASCRTSSRLILSSSGCTSGGNSSAGSAFGVSAGASFGFEGTTRGWNSSAGASWICFGSSGSVGSFSGSASSTSGGS